jgi:hypothetical protein
MMPGRSRATSAPRSLLEGTLNHTEKPNEKEPGV